MRGFTSLVRLNTKTLLTTLITPTFIRSGKTYPSRYAGLFEPTKELWVSTIMECAARVLRDHLISVGLVFVLFGPISTYAGTDSASCLLIEDAQIDVTVGFEQGIFGHANFGHEIQSGKNAVILIRSFRGTDGGADAQSFSKTTLEIQALPTDLFAREDRSIAVLRSFHTEGSAGFVPFVRHNCDDRRQSGGSSCFSPAARTVGLGR